VASGTGGSSLVVTDLGFDDARHLAEALSARSGLQTGQEGAFP
jgi:hypothetical protein